jgi:hemoglobin
MPGMYAALGGRPAFVAAVADFYRRVAGDPKLRDYFDATDLERLKAHQHSFLAMALGGPRAYVGRTMASAHSSLDVTDEAFDRVLDHLVSTLSGVGVPAELIREIVAGLLSLRHDIVRVPGTERERHRPFAQAPPPASPDRKVRTGPAPDWDERLWPDHSRPATPAAPTELDEAGSFEPHPDNPSHDQPVSRPRPVWR